MVFFLIDGTNRKKSIEINTPNETKTEIAIATSRESTKETKSNPVATGKLKIKQKASRVPQIAKETVSKDKATVPEKNKEQTETGEKSTSETTRKTIPGITQTAYIEAMTQSADLQTSGIDILNESVDANNFENLHSCRNKRKIHKHFCSSSLHNKRV